MATETESSGSKTFSMLGDTAESAKKAAKTTKRAIGIGLHKAAYGISYGVVYATVFLVELLPEEHVIRRGFVEGAEAALDARRKAKGHPKRLPFRRTPRPNAQTPKNKLRMSTSPRAKPAVEKRAAEFQAAAAEP